MPWVPVLVGLGGSPSNQATPVEKGNLESTCLCQDLRGGGCLLMALQKYLTLLPFPENSFSNPTVLGTGQWLDRPLKPPGEAGSSVQRAGQTQTPELGQGGTCTCSPLLGGHQGPVDCPSALSASCLPWNRRQSWPPSEAASQLVHSSASAAGGANRGRVFPAAITPSNFPSQETLTVHFSRC